MTNVNNEDFARRLTLILELHELSASLLADEIQINRSTISHLISGRNKPSLDLIIKLHKRFPDIDLEWWIYGKGDEPTIENSNASPPPYLDPSPTPAPDATEASLASTEKRKSESLASAKYKKAERVIIFFSDGTFSEYLA